METVQCLKYLCKEILFPLQLCSLKLPDKSIVHNSVRFRLTELCLDLRNTSASDKLPMQLPLNPYHLCLLSLKAFHLRNN